MPAISTNMLEWHKIRTSPHYWGEFQTHAFHVAPSMGPIVSIVNLQGQKNSLKKTRPVNQAW